MSDSTHLGLPYLEAAQAQKHVTVNEALRRLDALVQLSIVSRSLATPPDAPEEGARYIVAPSPTDMWEGRAGKVAAFIDGAWVFFMPGDGWRAWDEEAGELLVRSGGTWNTVGGAGGPTSAHGATTRMSIVEGDHVLAAGTASTPDFMIPDRGIVLGVTGHVIEAVTGASAWHLGVADDPERYGNYIGVAPGSTVIGVSGMPCAYYGATPLLVTAQGAAFTGGKLRLAIHCLELTGPAA
ncbi:conserved hypothetical protein [Parvibaculum lavamentivorans DS-1]|uniref:Uncharacterized protein n=1 Tax=Parvibaculum lavamentivorans (strain DS-1 / DSM 13023 / NCIMB 13966) TaxID=402881 RepID=A7HRL0_PARL1|nr:DUF2793 domain-containing protein [Parvibaculum lavamentivorans]ABS62543.1 conserved hypothetical protein [Parvibaculum lavamentivorans DS-1]